MMAHHSTDHAPAHTEKGAGIKVLFLLSLFFAMTAAGHYFFVIKPSAPTSETARILHDGNHH